MTDIPSRAPATSPHSFASIRSGRRPKPAAAIRRRASRQRTSWRRSSSREMRFDPKDPAVPRQRSLRAVEGARRADSLRRVGGSRALPARGAAEAPPHRLRSRGPPDAAAVVRGRRDRFARPGHLRGDRHRAQRAADQVRVPHLRAPRRRRDGRRVRLGSRRRRRLLRSSTTCARSSTSTRSVRAGPRSSATRWTSIAAPLEAPSAGTPSSSTATTSLPPAALAEARATKGRPSMILARTIKGKGIAVDRGEGRLARQGAEERRGGRQGDRRAREAARARRDRAGDSRAAIEGRPTSRPPTTRRCPRRPTRSATRSRRARRRVRRSRRSAPSIQRVVGLDADVKNSTFSDKFVKEPAIASSRCSSPSR